MCTAGIHHFHVGKVVVELAERREGVVNECKICLVVGVLQARVIVAKVGCAEIGKRGKRGKPGTYLWSFLYILAGKKGGRTTV